MLEHQERTAFLILVGVTIIVISANTVLGAIGKQPFAHPFSEVTPDGEMVVVEGNISQVTITHTGGHMTIILNNISVFIPVQIADGLRVQNGDRIRVYGTVQTYQGKKEIIVGAKDDLRVL